MQSLYSISLGQQSRGKVLDGFTVWYGSTPIGFQVNAIKEHH